jgi:hypothetical protein
MNEPRDRTQPENVFEPDEAGLSDDIDDGPTTMPADASEADVLDQSREVPLEDDAHDR